MLANHKGEIPVAILLLPFIAGIALGINYLSGADTGWLSITLGVLGAVFILLNLNYTRLNLFKIRWLAGCMIHLILFLAGSSLVVRYNELNSSKHFSKVPAQYILVKINSEPFLKNGYIRFTAAVLQSVYKGKSTEVDGTVMLAVKDIAAKNLYYGDELLIPAKYSLVDPPFVPAQFNYKKYLAGQNIFYQQFLYSKQFVMMRSGSGNPVIAASLRLRQRLVSRLKQNMRDTDAIAVASTLILGYKADLSNEVLQAYSKTGTVHVLSVSGAHVAIVYILLTLMLGFLDKFPHGRVTKAIIIILLIWFYAMLSGFSPAVCRAAVMISMVITGKTFNRHINTLNILAISAFGLLLYDPFFITDAGFQLSYLAVAGLIVFQPLVYKWFTIKNKFADKLWALCSVSIAAQVITFPLSAFYFHQFPVYFLVSNLFIIVPSAIIMYTGIAYLLLPQIPFLSASLAFLLEKTILLMNKGLAFIESAPWASIGKIWITVPEYILLYVIIISLFYFFYDKKALMLKIAGLALLFFCVSISIKRIHAMQSDAIAFLNVGKHKGIIFKHAGTALVLSDLQPSDQIYRYAIQPYLDSCKIGNSQIVGLNKDFKSRWITKKGNYIQCFNQRMLLVQNPLLDIPRAQKLDLNYIYITVNQKDIIKTLNKSLNYHTLILDAGVSRSTIVNFQRLADSARINYKILKRNNSFVTVSN
jgi:competence protein ComEC